MVTFFSEDLAPDLGQHLVREIEEEVEVGIGEEIEVETDEKGR